MSEQDLAALRRRSVHLRGLADLRLVTVADGPASGARLVEMRTPQGLAAEIALDRSGDLLRLALRGHELGWHSAPDGATPWPALDAEDGLGFLRGFDGFLVTCGLDHHGLPATTDASHFRYPPRRVNHHPLHGRIMAAKAELLEKRLDWGAGEARIALLVRQASVFGEVLELERLYRFSLDAPRLRIEDRVTNRGFRPVRHGILYHVNLGHPFLGPDLRVDARSWAPAAALAADPALPDDDHVEKVDAAPSPPDGVLRAANPVLGLALTLRYDPARLPITAAWRAWASGVFALGLEPQTRLDDPDMATLAPGASILYLLDLDLS